MVGYYESPTQLDQGAEIVTLGGVAKFPSLWETNQAHKDFLLHYRAILFLEDDIEIRFEDVDRLFDVFCHFDLALAQPSLSHRSYCSWPITLCCPSFRLRFTNFVEIMAPLFSAFALARCLDTFHRSTSGWGLDLTWPALLGHPRDRIAIIDEVVVTHTKPIDPQNGRLYQYLRSIGVDPYQELHALSEQHGLGPDHVLRQYGGVLSPQVGPERRVRFV